MYAGAEHVGSHNAGKKVIFFMKYNFSDCFDMFLCKMIKDFLKTSSAYE